MYGDGTLAESIETLAANLESDSADTRAAAAEQLAQRGAEASAVAARLARACGDQDERVAEWGASALEEAGPPPAAQLNPLIEVLQEQNAGASYWAATLLGRLESAAAPAVEFLASAVADSPHASVRERSAWALGRIGTSATPALPCLQTAAGGQAARLARLAQEAIERIES